MGLFPFFLLLALLLSSWNCLRRLISILFFMCHNLKPFLESNHPTEPTQPPPVYADRRGGVFEVETILGKRRVRNSWHYLVKWTGYDDFDNTWEPLANVRHLSDLVAAAPLMP
jgi:hypothetical protein